MLSYFSVCTSLKPQSQLWLHRYEYLVTASRNPDKKQHNQASEKRPSCQQMLHFGCSPSGNERNVTNNTLRHCDQVVTLERSCSVNLSDFRAVLWKVPLSVHHQWDRTKLCTQPSMWGKPQTLSHTPGLQPITWVWAKALLSAGFSLSLSVSRSRSTSAAPLCAAVTVDRLCVCVCVWGKCVWTVCAALSAEACVIYNHLELLEVSAWMFIFLLCPITLRRKQKTKHPILHADLWGGNSA